MKNKFKITVILILILISVSGCSADRKNMTATDEKTTEFVTNQGTDTQKTPTADEKSSDLVTIAKASEASYRVKQFIPLSLDESDTEASRKRIFTDSYGGRLYLLVCCYSEDDTLSSLTMYTFDMDSLKTEKLSFSLTSLEHEAFSAISVSSMYVTGENELTLLLYGSFEGEEASFVLYRTDMTGKPLDAENPLSDETEAFTNFIMEGHKLFTLPNNASVLTEWKNDTNTTQIYRYDTSTGEKFSWIALPNESVDSLCSSDDAGTLYYIGNGELKRLDTKTQVSEILCDIQDCGISSHTLQLLINDREEFAICSIEGDKPSIYLLTNEKNIATDMDTIHLVRLSSPYGMEYTSRLAASWSVTSGVGHIEVEKTDEIQEQEALRNQTMADIVSGKGPELMWVSKADMRILAEKGALMDISELIPQDVTKQLLPGALHAGTVDDALVGITPEVYFRTLMAPNSVWNKNTWTTSDVINLVEAHDDWEWPLIFSIAKPDFYTLFYGLIVPDLTSSPFMDIENGISYFNDDEFIKIMNFCKKYGAKDLSATADWNVLSQMLRDGTCAAQQCFFYEGLADFSLQMRQFESCKIVGFPRNEGSGSYLDCEGYLVVNANAVHIDAIKDFIACLLDYENQYTTNWTSVRKDVLRDSVVMLPSGTPCILKSTGNPVYVDLETKPDGTSYLEEFMSFAESCEPSPYCPQEITNILGEELPYYVSGDKSAKEVADVIHRKVQLYFDEHK